MRRGEDGLAPSSSLAADSTSGEGDHFLAIPPHRQRGARCTQAAMIVAAAACVGLFGIALTSLVRNEVSLRPVEEAVNDHLRQLYRDKPVELSSGDQHQVAAWLEGRVDFQPVIFGGDVDYSLAGGSVGYFLDRKAAVLAYTGRRHPASLLVFQAAGLEWPGGPVATVSRGFCVLRWRDGDLAYALVSDSSPPELQLLGEHIRAGQ